MKPAQSVGSRNWISNLVGCTAARRKALLMAAISQLFFSPSLSLSKPPIRVQNPCQFSLVTTQNRSSSTKLFADINDFLGDFGARDPFPAEIASNFGANVLGNYNTEHNILIPNLAALSLSQQDCSPISPAQSPFSELHAKQLLRKVVGWRLINEEGKQKLQGLWKLRDYKSCIELVNRIYNVVEATGHFPNLHIQQPNEVRAELWTSSIGGLSMNDFIVASKIDDINTSDLVPKKRVWA